MKMLPRARTSPHCSPNAFTLIELSIVLVIIGLIAGGVLVGKDLIEGAGIRAQLSQIEGYTVAANTFRLKYNCQPGDCANAVALGLGTDANAAGHNGNSDGVIPSELLNTVEGRAARAEFFNFWYHLQQASLLEGQPSGYSLTLAVDPTTNVTQALPIAKLDKDLYVAAITFDRTYNSYTTAAGNAFFVASPTFANGTLATGVGMSSQGISTLTAHRIDIKMDDGLPQTGKVRTLYRGSGPTGSYQFSVYNETSGTKGRACFHNTNIYDLQGAYPGGTTANYKDCGLAFLYAF